MLSGPFPAAKTPAPAASPPPVSWRPDDEPFVPPKVAATVPPTESWAPVGLLFLSLLGFLGVAYLLYSVKFDGVASVWGNLPTRVVFVFLLALTTAPFLLTIFRKVPVLYLIPSVVLISFLYPIFSPYGLPFSRDAVFNLQFANSILTSGTWQPLAGVTGQAGVYSYYPGGAIFNAEAASMTGLPINTTFLFATALLRVLIIPLAIYALSARLFGARSAALGVLFYLSVPSIELNVPTQQDFAVTFFVLAFAALAFLATEGSVSRNLTMLRVTLVVAIAMVIVSHHVSTYILLGFLGGIALLPWVFQRRDPYPAARSIAVLLGAVGIAFAWVALVSLPVLEAQRGILGQNLLGLLHPGTAGSQAVIPGATFPLYLVIWIVIAAAAEAILALVVLAENYSLRDRSFVTFALLTGVLVAILSVPFVSTGFNFLVLRQFEFTGVIFAPAAAWWITAHLAGKDRDPSGTSTTAATPTPAVATSRRSARPGPPAARRALYAGVAVILVVFIFAGGALVPLSTRDQFAQRNQVLIDSPVHINQTVYAAAVWAQGHLSNDHPIWGDYLAYTVFGGFGGFRLRYDSYPLFAGTTFNSTALVRLHVSDYVVVDSYMTQPVLQPVFYGPTSDQPSAPLTTAELQKFDNPEYFALLYQDTTFTIYQVVKIPPS